MDATAITTRTLSGAMFAQNSAPQRPIPTGPGDQVPTGQVSNPTAQNPIPSQDLGIGATLDLGAAVNITV